MQKYTINEENNALLTIYRFKKSYNNLVIKQLPKI